MIPMARCEICGRKLKDPTKRYCGGNKCTHKTALPRCQICGALIKAEGQKCPSRNAPGGMCVPSEEVV